MFPTFAAHTLHYGIRCDETEKLSISATPNPETATVQVSGGGGGGVSKKLVKFSATRYP